VFIYLILAMAFKSIATWTTTIDGEERS